MRNNILVIIPRFFATNNEWVMSNEAHAACWGKGALALEVENSSARCLWPILKASVSLICRTRIIILCRVIVKPKSLNKQTKKKSTQLRVRHIFRIQ